MTKMIYVARCDATKDAAAIFDLAHTYDLAEARKSIEWDKHYKTKREDESRRWYIEGWNIESREGRGAKEAYDDWSEDFCCLPDPDFYEEA